MASRRLDSFKSQLGGRNAQQSATAAELEAALAQGIKDGKIPLAIVHATNADGSFQYHHAQGYQRCGIDDAPLEDDDPMIMMASQTKLLTAIAVMKAVELGLVALDDDVTPHLPELGKSPILTGFDDDDKPILQDRKNPITLVHLLTHTSGLSYAWEPKILQYRATHPHAAFRPTIVECYDEPLLFEPGTSWTYSPGLDWAGLLLERRSGLSLEAFEQQHLWRPLGITDITFWPARLSDPPPAIPQLVIRDPRSGALRPSRADHLNTHSTDCFGGHGGHARLGDYLRVQRSLLANDGALLRPSSVDALFAPRLGAASGAALNGTLRGLHAFFPGEFNLDIPMQYALGGLLFLADDAGRRKKGTLNWGGYFNPFWVIDREAGLAFTFGTQMLPPGDPGAKEMTGLAERAVYKMAGVV